MSNLDKFNYECEGQIEISEYFVSKIKRGQVKDLTDWINSQGKAQYTQIGEVIRDTYEHYKESGDLVDRLTNAVSVYVLSQSARYMEYLKSESGVSVDD